MNKAYLLTGGNLGNRAENMRQALLLINNSAGKVLAASALYETAAWGTNGQPDYLNQAVVIETELQPASLMVCLLNIEKQLGRERQEKYGARTMDIDILFYGEMVIKTPTLVIPHQQLQHRRFVLVPLAEIDAQLVHPILHKTIGELLIECIDPLNVKKYSGTNHIKQVDL